MQPPLTPNSTLAASTTYAASKQTYYTVRFLVDEPLVTDAYLAYAYFRWVDDTLDQKSSTKANRLAFVQRQQSLLESCERGASPASLAVEEQWLAHIIAKNRDKNSGLHAYNRHMMAVMAFDAERRGRLISQHELNEYTHWLAVAVTEALHHFIGHCCTSPHSSARYLAATGAHIAHMLRDTLEDAEAGYYNIPREVLAVHGITPWDVSSQPYRDWVKERVLEARACFRAGREYLARVENFRCRLAGYAYIQRFEGVLLAIEREGYILRADYSERKGWRNSLGMFWNAFWLAVNYHPMQPVPPVVPVKES